MESIPNLHDYAALPSWCNPTRLVHAFRLDEATIGNNVLTRQHYHLKKTERRRYESIILSRFNGRRPTVQVAIAGVFVARHCFGSLDWDNAYGGLKPVLDCLVAPSKRNPSGLGFLTDDNPKSMPEPPYVRQLKAKRGAAFTDIFVFDCAEQSTRRECRALSSS